VAKLNLAYVLLALLLATTANLANADEFLPPPTGLAEFPSFASDTFFEPPAGSPLSFRAQETTRPVWQENLTLFAGLDGSKQPQDFGVNANLGPRFAMDTGIPLMEEYGLGLHIGTSLVMAENAVRVYELVGEDEDRLQNFNTIGLYQRLDNGFSWAVAYDVLIQSSFDSFVLSQWRFRTAYQIAPQTEVGFTLNIASLDDDGTFGAAPVTLTPINMGTFFVRQFWQSGTQTTLWVGMGEGHGEDNPVTGRSAPADDHHIIGDDLLAQLKNQLALYGETNLTLPADTGSVDAFLGIQWYPWGNSYKARRGSMSPVLPMAGSPSFTVDLRQP